MEITCLQMDVLISFYIEGELTDSLRKKVEKHLSECSACRAKYNIINSLFNDLKSIPEGNDEYSNVYPSAYPTKQYKNFKNNLSAYVDNELPPDENIKIKKYTINNKKARKDLEETYHIRKLMKDSFQKTKAESKPDFSRKILKELNPGNTGYVTFPLIKTATAFVVTVAVLSFIILLSLTL